MPVLDEEIDAFCVFLLSVRGCSPETERAYRQHLGAFSSWCRREGVDGLQIGGKGLRRYLAYLHAARYQGSTISAHLSAIRSFYRWLVRDGVIDINPADVLVSPKLVKRLPTTVACDQLELLFEAPDTRVPGGIRDACMLELLYATGARISELAGLNIESFESDHRLVRLFGKRSKERIVPLHRRAVSQLESYIDGARPALVACEKRCLREGGEHALFISDRGAPMDASALRYRFCVLRRRAGLPDSVTPHTMRHTFATDLLVGGADLRSVQELLGHASLSTTQVYTHLSPEALKSAVRLAHPRS